MGSASARNGWMRSASVVAAATLLLYLLWTAAYVATGHGSQDFIVIGSTFIRQSNASPLIHYDPRYHYTDRLGYDGQFCYFIALDPQHAYLYMDLPAYRYSRIAYPMLARILAAGVPALIPFALILINLIAVPAGTFAVAVWLRRKGRSPWLALIYGLSLGLFIAYNGDLTEPMAYALAALAVYLLDFGGRRRVLWAGLCFAVAILTRETAAVFAVLYAGALLLRRNVEQSTSPTPVGFAGSIGSIGAALRWRFPNWRAAALLLGLSLAPYALYKLFLAIWLGSAGVPAQVRFEVLPFAGLLAHWPWDAHHIVVIESVVLPALVCAGVALWALARGARDVAIWTLLVSVLLFVVLLPAASYTDHFAASRLSIGIVLAALYCVPSVDSISGGRRTWLFAATLLWMVFLPLQVVGLLHAVPAGY